MSTKAVIAPLPLSAYGKARSTVQGSPLSSDELRKTHAYWRACNYLALGTIYLQANPLLKEPLKPEHIKSRLLGHWGSSPGLAFIYIHLNRLIKKFDLDMIFMTGPGHGAPGVLGPGFRGCMACASRRDQFQIPGTRVLQFAFDGQPDNPYLPHNFVSNTVAYTGTHDNPPTREWYEQLPDAQKQTLWSYLNRRLVNSAEAAPALIELAWSSVAALTIAPLQDVFDLGTGARMNVPGRANGNWRWRFTEEMVSATAFEWLRELTNKSNRCASARSTARLGKKAASP
jgi:hypothetical protein